MDNENEIRLFDALRCNHCGKVVERGIVRVIDHLDKCGGNMNDIEANVYDAEYEIIDPKQLTNKKQNHE